MYWGRIYAWWSYGSCEFKETIWSKACTLDNNWQPLIWWSWGLLITNFPSIGYIQECIELNYSFSTVWSKACTLDNKWQALIWWRWGLLMRNSPVIGMSHKNTLNSITLVRLYLRLFYFYFFHLKQRQIHIKQFFGTI